MCVAERAAADPSSSARRRADELLEGGAPRTSSRISAQALARSGPGRRVSGSARRGGVDARRSAIGACGACGSCRNAPRTGLCGWIGGCARAGIVSGVRTARPERASRRGAAPEEHVSVTLETDGSCTNYWYNEPFDIVRVVRERGPTATDVHTSFRRRASAWVRAPRSPRHAHGHAEVGEESFSSP